MNAVIYFSCSGNSKDVAENLSKRICYDLYEICDAEGKIFENVAMVFPVHCQSLPVPIKKFLPTLEAKYVTLIATYGRVHCGNALYEAAKLIKGEIVAAAYLPSNHTYYEKGEILLVPEEIINKIYAPSPVTIPKLRKTPFAGFFPAARSRLGVRIKKNENYVNCGICGGQCPIGAIKSGRISFKCVRCLKCVYNCPNGALTVKLSRIMKLYLRKTKFEETIIYV